VLAFSAPAANTPQGLLVGGELLALASCGWLLVSVLFLGRCFGVLPEARGLVTSGPYRLVRHPVYLGEIGACAGLAIAAPRPGNVVALSAVIAAQFVRMSMEERALSAAFPGYARYAARTGRLLPRLRLRALWTRNGRPAHSPTSTRRRSRAGRPAPPLARASVQAAHALLRHVFGETLAPSANPLPGQPYEAHDNGRR
jgi:hypothetical protein